MYPFFDTMTSAKPNVINIATCVAQGMGFGTA